MVMLVDNSSAYWVEKAEGPGMVWFNSGGGWRFNCWWGPLWRVAGWRWVADNPNGTVFWQYDWESKRRDETAAARRYFESDGVR